MNMILLLLLLVQDVSLDGLRSDDPELRQAAEAKLREAPFSRILEALRTETDPEVRGRLHAIRGRHIARVEELYRAGDLEGSLKKQVEVEGEDDVEAGFARRLRVVEAKVAAILRSAEGCKVMETAFEPLWELSRREGRWCYPALIRGLHGKGSLWCLQVLSGRAPDVYPALRAALRSSAPPPGSTWAIVQVVWSRRDWDELAAIEGDPALSEAARACARDFLKSRDPQDRCVLPR